MATKGRQLAQARPADTTAASAYSPDGSATVTRIFACNQSGSPSTYRIFHDEDGTTYDETTALFWDIALLADETHILDVDLGMNDDSGNLAVRSGNASAITFTVYGYEDVS